MIDIINVGLNDGVRRVLILNSDIMVYLHLFYLWNLFFILSLNLVLLQFRVEFLAQLLHLFLIQLTDNVLDPRLVLLHLVSSLSLLLFGPIP